MKILITSFLALFLSLNCFSQTERIAHRSHSGKNKNFKITGKDNWGLPSYVVEQQLKADSIAKSKGDTLAGKSKKGFHCKKCKAKAAKKHHKPTSK